MLDERHAQEILIANWSSYIGLVGEDRLTEIIQDVRNKKDFVRSDELTGGDQFDFSYAIDVLKDAAVLVSTCLTVYQSLKSILGRKPTEKEVKEEVESRLIGKKISDTVKVKQDSIIQDLVSKDDATNSVK